MKTWLQEMNKNLYWVLPVFTFLGGFFVAWDHPLEAAPICTQREFYQLQVRTTLEDLAAIQRASHAKYGYYNAIVSPPDDPADSACACPNNTPYTYESMSSPFAFMVRATGNLDDDEDLDVWMVTSTMEKVVHMSVD